MEQKENRLSIGRINGVEIYAVKDENDQTFVPIRPICEAIGVSFQGQHAKLKEDLLLSSTVNLRLMVGADGKQREMVSLPLMFVYGWLFRIDARNVGEEARESVLKYQMECYTVLYDYFNGRSRRQIESNRAEKAILGKIERLTEEEKTIKAQLKEAKESLSKIRTSRLDDQPSLFDGMEP